MFKKDVWLKKPIGLDWIHLHSLRHFYATNLLRNEVNIRVVQYLLGHKKLETTVDTELQNAIKKFEDPFLAKRSLQSIYYTLCKPLSVIYTGPVGFEPTTCSSEGCRLIR